MNRENDFLRVDRFGPIFEVVLTNPGQLNAMSPAFFAEIKRIFEQIDRDPDARVVIVWAEGRIFSAGLDLNEAINLIPEDSPSEASRRRHLYVLIREFQQSFRQIHRCSKPVIAAVHGWCMGGGLDLATACDMRYCTSQAHFSIHETKMAMVADLGTLQRISSLIGKGMAREMAFTGEAITADQARDCGLVNAVYPDKDTLLAETRAIAQTIVNNSSLVVEGVKQVLNYADEHSEEDGLEQVAQWNTSFFISDDLNEAVQAFIDKRTPKFRGQ